MGSFLRGLLSVPEANSRFVYLLWTITMCAAFLMTLHGFLNAPPADRSQFGNLMMVIGAGHIGGSVSRLATKIGDKIQGDKPYGQVPDKAKADTTRS